MSGSYGRFPFGSSTGDSRYSLFFGPQEQELFDDYSTELLEIVAETSVKYWRIEKDFSNPNGIYGESDTKVARDPVTVFCWISVDEPVTETGRYGTDVKRRLELYMHKERLVEVGVIPRIGDFVEYDNQFFEAQTADVPRAVYTHPQTKLSVVVRCLSTREGVFDGMRSNDIEIDADSANPF